MSVKNDLKNLADMVKSMDEQLNMFREMMDTSIQETYKLDLSIKDILNKITNEEIENMDEADVNRLLSDSSTDGYDNNKSLEGLYNSSFKTDNDNYKDLSLFEFKKKIVLEIKKTLSDVNSLEKDKTKIVNEANSAYDNYFNYVNSEEYKNKKREKLEEIKAQAESEEDPIEKKKILEKISVIEKSESLEFLTERLEKYNPKEANNITDIFFNNTRSTVVMDKFKSRLPKFGYNPDIYKRFLNIEEMFLPEEYRDLNNIFLFVVMRYISFTDTYNQYDTVYVSAILIRLYNLVYHKFENTELEKEFIEFIKMVDDYFMPNIERFTKYNTTSPNHPERQERDRQYEEKRRMMIIASLQNEGIEPDTTLDTETLRSMLQDVIDKKEKESSGEDVETAEEVLDNMSAEETHEEPAIAGMEDLENLIDAVESSPLIDEMDELTESMGGTLIPEEPVETEVVVEEDLTVERRVQKTEIIKDAKVETPMIEATLEDLKEMVDDIELEVEAYKDGYGNYYIESNEEEGIYSYCDEKGEIIEEGVKYDEETILRLVSTGSVEKCTLII